MTRREWWLAGGLVIALLVIAWLTGRHQQRQGEIARELARMHETLSRLEREIESGARTERQMLEARVIVLEKVQGRIRARLEMED